MFGRSVARALALGGALLALLAIPAVASARTAFVANQDSDNVTPIDTATGTAGAAIGVGAGPMGIAITPDGDTAYVANFGSDNVTPIDTATNTADVAIGVGAGPLAIAIAPDGDTAYVTNVDSNNVTPIDLQTNTAGAAVGVGSSPEGVAITPDGETAYVTNAGSNNVTPIDTATNTAGTPIAVGSVPIGIAITPDGQTAYVANLDSDNVTPIDTATNTPGATIGVGSTPNAIAITPDGETAYVANANSNDVTPIDTQTNTAGAAIEVGDGPRGIAITPDGRTAYVANEVSDNVTPIDTATNTAEAAIGVGIGPAATAITPDQPPEAAFAAGPVTVGSPTRFDAMNSTDPDGSIADYAWDYGDGGGDSTSSPTSDHTYASVRTYNATLTATDDEGCSTEFVFTGQTASCNGSGVARVSHAVEVLPQPPTPAELEITDVELDRRDGIALLTVETTVAGGLWIDKTKNVKLSERIHLDAAGSAVFEVDSRKKAAGRLKRHGRARVNPRVLFTPTATSAKLGKRKKLKLRMN